MIDSHRVGDPISRKLVDAAVLGDSAKVEDYQRLLGAE